MSSWIQRLCAALGIGIGSRIALVVEPSLADAFFPVKGLSIRAWDPDVLCWNPIIGVFENQAELVSATS